MCSIRSIFGDSRVDKTADEENFNTNSYEQSQTERKLIKKINTKKEFQGTRCTAQYGQIDE